MDDIMKPLIDNVISNYYGTLSLIKNKDKYFLILENYDSPSKVKVSEEFALAFIKEFKGE